jgi:hypothetical protein
MHCFFAAFALVPAIVRSCCPQLQIFQWCQVLLNVSHCHFSTQIRMVLISVTFSCASYISDNTCSKGNSFVMHVTAVLLFCYCQQCIMAHAQFDCLKQLSVSHDSYHSDDYSTQHFVFFLLPVGCADMTSILYCQFSALEFSFCNSNQPVHTVVIRGMIIFLKPLKPLHIADLIGPSLGSTVNTSTLTHCSIVLCNSSVRYTY